MQDKYQDSAILGLRCILRRPKPDEKMEAALLESDHYEKSESNSLLGTYLEESGLGAHNPLPNIT